jgi:NADPH:quinone reductase-like Zn-dependent oxidoreductase
MKAVVLNGTNATVVDLWPVPKFRDDYLLVKTVAVALNPTNAKAISQGRAANNGLSGCDYAGIMEEVGPSVTKHHGKRAIRCLVVHMVPTAPIQRTEPLQR